VEFQVKFDTWLARQREKLPVLAEVNPHDSPTKLFEI